MTDSAARTDVAVSGGALATYRLGDRTAQAPGVLAIHGITSNSRAWLAVAGALDGAAWLAAVDLRGRGASNQLPAPFGIAAHVADMVAVLDHLQLERATVVGHSLGAYIAAGLAAAHPDRIGRLVLVDGGLSIPAAREADPDAFMQAFLGPTLARLRMTFTDRDAYRGWWAGHPALAGADIDPELLAAYADYDLTGSEPELRSSVNPDSIGPDGRDVIVARDAEKLAVAAILLCAPRGMVDDPNPMQPLEIVSAWAGADPQRRRARQVADVNHYTIVFGRRGAQAVAAEISAAVGSA